MIDIDDVGFLIRAAIAVTGVMLGAMFFVAWLL